MSAPPRRAALRLVPVAAASWATAAGSILAPDAAPWIALVLWTMAAGGVAGVAVQRRCARRPSKQGTAAVVFVLTLAAAASVASHVALAEPARRHVAALALEGGRAVEVHLDVTGKVERRSDGSLGFDARASRIATGPVAHIVSVEIEVRVAPELVERREALDVGAEVRARGTASAPRPGERAALMVWASRGAEVIRGPTGPAAAAAHLRQSLVRAVDGLPGSGAGLVPGLAVGDTSAVTAELDTAMKESSLSHLTAVSGANCAIVVGIAFVVAAFLGASRRMRVTSGLATLVGFVLLVTPEPSVARAAVMAAIAMTALLLGRPGAGISILSLAVAVLLIADPWLAASLGFALSSAATASLLLLARPLAAGLARIMPRPLALAIAVPLAAQLACGPLLILIEPRVPLYGVMANLVAGPAAPAATVLGLAACVSAPLPWLQGGLAALAWVPASWIAGTATTVSALPGDLVPWLEGWPGAALLALASAAVAVVIAVPRAASRRRRLVSGVSGAALAVVVGTALGGMALETVAGRWTLPSSWSVLACDVGQGDAVLLRSGTAVALVDTGPEAGLLAACLSRAGVDRVDLLVLTHFDVDHVGGVDAVIGRIGTVLHGPPDADGRTALDALAAGGARLVDAHAGLSGALGDSRWRVLWPRMPSPAFPVGNDASVVLDVRGGGIPPTLLLGDLSASPQRALMASDALSPPYAIVKVAHHGSADQHADLYDAAAPAIALVTVGVANDYGHPREEILTILDRIGARTARTDQDGVVAVSGSGSALSVWRERGG